MNLPYKMIDLYDRLDIQLLQELKETFCHLSLVSFLQTSLSKLLIVKKSLPNTVVLFPCTYFLNVVYLRFFHNKKEYLIASFFFFFFYKTRLHPKHFEAYITYKSQYRDQIANNITVICVEFLNF